MHSKSAQWANPVLQFREKVQAIRALTTPLFPARVVLFGWQMSRGQVDLVSLTR